MTGEEQARNRRKPLEQRFPRHPGEMRPFTFYKAAKHCRSITTTTFFVCSFDSAPPTRSDCQWQWTFIGATSFQTDCSINSKVKQEFCTEARESIRVIIFHRNAYI